MRCPEDPKTYTILMTIDGEEKNWCQRCRAYHPNRLKETESEVRPSKSKSEGRPEPGGK